MRSDQVFLASPCRVNCKSEIEIRRCLPWRKPGSGLRQFNERGAMQSLALLGKVRPSLRGHNCGVFELQISRQESWSPKITLSSGVHVSYQEKRQFL
jgi:hypothetical protein